jgi:hypothetical protein
VNFIATPCISMPVLDTNFSEHVYKHSESIHNANSKTEMSTNLFPECIKSKASLIFSKGMLWVTNSSSIIFLFKYSSTSFGTLSLLFHP